MQFENNPFAEVSQNWKEAFSKEGGVNGKGFLNALKTDASTVLHKIGRDLTDGKGFVKHNDNIYIPLGQKTLIGTDFDKLYGASARITADTLSTDQGAARFLRVNAGYDTELRSDFCNKASPVTYDNLSPYDRAVYEISTLTKACAYADGGHMDKNNVDAYKQTMDQYKNYCESNGMSWNEVLKEVSTEMQAESFYYKQEKNYSQFNLAADSHKMMLQAAGPDFHDELRNAFRGEFTSVEDTMKHSTFADRVTKDDGSFSIKAGVSEVFHTVLDKGYRVVLYAVDTARGVWDSMKDIGKKALSSDKAHDTKEFIGDLGAAVKYDAMSAMDDGSYAEKQAIDAEMKDAESKLTPEQKVAMLPDVGSQTTTDSTFDLDDV